MPRDIAERALQEFSQKMGIANLQFDHSGTALLAFGEKQELIFYYTEQGDQLQVWSPFTDLMLSGNPAEDCILMEYLLKKNFPAFALNGAYFAVDTDIGVVLLGRNVTVDMANLDTFSDTITAFAQQVLALTVAITKEVSQAAVVHQTHDEPDHNTPIIKA